MTVMNEMIPAQAAAPPARLGRVLGDAARSAWDRLGLLLGVSFTWMAALSAPLSLERALPRGTPGVAHLAFIAAIPLFTAAPTAGAFALAHRIASHREAAYGDLWRDGVAHFGAALRLQYAQVAVTSLLVTALVFYARIPAWPARAAVSLCGYVLLLWLMMLAVQWPLFILQESGALDDADRRARRGAIAAIRRSAFLALGRPFFSAALLAAAALITVAMAATAVLPAILWAGVMAMLTTIATRALLVEYGVLPPPPAQEPVPDLQFRIGDTAARRP
ncbi:MAG TPA: hypothetical protein VKT77_13980 [Chthonomonadaceae bacterium]|nr:hypothetical protein [Chthonomonadaceae bacterium]